MHERYLSQIKDKDKIKAWKWQRKSNIKECTQLLIVSAQEQAVKTNCVKFDKDKTTESPLCRIYVVENETVSHVIPKGNKKRHENICRCIDYRICEKHGFEGAPQWYKHEPDGGIENKQRDSMGFYNPV